MSRIGQAGLAQINTVYLVTEDGDSFVVYTAAGGIGEEPYLLPGTKFSLQVEFQNLTVGRLFMFAKAKVGSKWYQSMIEEIAANTADVTYLPERIVVDGLMYPPWITFRRGRMRVLVEVHAGNRRQQRIQFWIHQGPTAEEEVSIFSRFPRLPFQEKPDW